TAISAVMIPVVSRMAIAMGKAMQQAVMMLVSGIGGIIVYLVNPSSVTGAVIFFGVYTLAQTSFWQLSNAVFYDIVEVDEWVNNKRREGDMSSLISVTGTIISSFMIWIFGILFDIAGYDPSLAVQPSGVVPFLNAAVVLVPSVLYLLCFAALKACPINKKTFESLQKALALRKEGKDYSMYMDDVNKILGKKN
ncbi:MAG: MFS transporter, partial [Clostridia bacterium]|nr:MFS transporter [Clostridia bacterium]